MANTIAKAVAYIKSPEALAEVFKSVDPFAEVVKPNKAIGTDTIQYQKTTFGSYTLGTFNRVSGYSSKDIVREWVTRKLTQDMGDSLAIDKMDDEESMATGIVSIANDYIRKIQVPEVTKYRAKKFCDGAGTVVTTAVDASTVASLIITDINTLVEKGVDVNQLVLYVNPTINGYLQTATFGKGYVTQGNWNGKLQTQVAMFDTALLKVVPARLLGTGVQWILAHEAALYPFVKYNEGEYFDKVPGYGARRKQVDIGIYHDAWIEPGMEDAVLIHVIAPTAPKMTPDGAAAWEGTSQVIKIASDDNAKIYYTIGDTEPTDPTGEVSDTEFLYEGPITITATKSIKAIAIRWGVKSTVTSKTFTKAASGN